jgi:hypothetical protein
MKYVKRDDSGKVMGYQSAPGNGFDEALDDEHPDLLAYINGPFVPQSVTPLQARKALRQAGLYDAVMAWISQQSDEVQETWEYALEIRRDNPIIAAAAAELELTEQQVDDLFIAAAQYD